MIYFKSPCILRIGINRYYEMKKLSLFLLLIALFSITPHLHADVKSAQLSIDVPAGKWKSVRLKNLPKNAAVRIEVESDNAVTLSVMDEKNYKKYPNIKRPLLQSRVVNKFSFTVKIPVSGHYYVVFDNSAGLREAKLDVNIVGASGSDSIPL